MRVIAVLLLLCSPAYGQRAFVEGPQTVKPGSLVSLRASTEATALIWWIVNPPDTQYEVLEGNKRLIFASGCKAGATYSVSLFGVPIDGDKIVGEPFQERHVVIVEGSAPPPDPDPEPPPPDPDPKPDIPAGKYGIAPLTYKWAMQIQSPNRTTEAARFAGAIEGTVSKVGALPGNFTEPQKVMDEYYAQLEALGSGFHAGWSAWQQSVLDEIERQYKLSGGGIKTPKQFAEFLGEAAVGLRAVR